MNAIQKSDSIKTGLRMGFQDDGSKMVKRRCYGYTVNSDGELMINQAEFAVVHVHHAHTNEPLLGVDNRSAGRHDHDLTLTVYGGALLVARDEDGGISTLGFEVISVTLPKKSPDYEPTIVTVAIASALFVTASLKSRRLLLRLCRKKHIGFINALLFKLFPTEEIKHHAKAAGNPNA